MTEGSRLRDAASELLARIETEVSRPPGTAETHLIGGLARIGSKLEKLLRTALEMVCAERGSEATEFLPGRRRSLRTAMAGELARALSDAAGEQGCVAHVLVEDLRGPRSILRRVMEMRNKAAHEGYVPPDAADVLQALRRLVERVAR